MNLGEYVVKYRTAHGLSQRKFAEECGLSNGYISMIEKSLNPQTGTKITPSLPALKKLFLHFWRKLMISPLIYRTSLIF